MGGWSEEQYESLYRMAGLLERMGYDWEICEMRYLQAYDFCSSRAEPLFQIAKHWYTEKKYALAYLFIQRAYQIPFPTHIRLFINPSVYDF